MDGLVCPSVAGFLRLTQKLKARIQKKKDSSGNDLCPICGCESNKGNLCQACFMRSFKPIAYARNIKVVEQNEFFFGPGKKRWRCKNRAEATCGTYKTKDKVKMSFGGTLKMTMSPTNTLGNPLDSSDNFDDSGECNSDRASAKDEYTSPDTPKPMIHNDNQFEMAKLTPSSELVQIDLVDVNTTTQTEEEALEPLPKFVPDFWESPQQPDNYCMTSKLRTFTDHVVKGAQRPFKELFCDSNTNIIDPGDRKQEHEATDANFSTDVYNEVLEKVQQLTKPSRIECCKSVDTETQCISNARQDNEHLAFSKQLKQNAILQLLKVAFKTNMILNNLFQYFKKVVESDGSNSENSESDQKLQLDHKSDVADSKISVDSFFFPHWQSGIRSGTNAAKHPQGSNPGVMCEPCVPGEHPSDTEVISKSQATLSMLNQTAWGLMDQTSPENNLQDDQDDFIGPFPGRRSIFESDSPIDRLITRKFHSEHSKLRLKRHQDNNPDDNINWGSSDLENQPSSVIVANGTAADRGISLGNPSFPEQPSSATESNQSGKSLLDLVFGLNRTCVKPSLLPLPDCQEDLITLSPEPSKDDILETKSQKDADSQTALSSRHLEQEMNLLHKAFLDQLAHFSVQLVESCKTFGHSWQTSFLAELVEHFRTACNIISSFVGESCLNVPSSDMLDELQDVSNQISICLTKLRTHPHSFVGDCSDHDISTLLSSPPDQSDFGLVNTWV